VAGGLIKEEEENKGNNLYINTTYSYLSNENDDRYCA
jgi:hypothetical protein